MCRTFVTTFGVGHVPDGRGLLGRGAGGELGAQVQRFDLVRRRRPAEEVALAEAAAAVEQELPLRLASRRPPRGASDPRLRASWMIVVTSVAASSSPGMSRTNERSILSVSTALRQAAERRVAGAEVVDRDRNPRSLQLLERPATSPIRLGHERRLGDLDRQPVAATPNSSSVASTSRSSAGCQSTRRQVEPDPRSTPRPTPALAWRQHSRRPSTRLADQARRAPPSGGTRPAERGRARGRSSGSGPRRRPNSPVARSTIGW